MAGMCSAQVHPTAGVNRRFDLSPIYALIYLGVGCRLCCQIPVRLDVHPVIHLRITVLPQWRTACGGDVWGLAGDPDVIEDLPDLRALGGDEGD